MTQLELDQKIDGLRKEWKTAGPGMRRLILKRVELLKKRFKEEQQVTEPKATFEFAEQLLNPKEV